MGVASTEPGYDVGGASGGVLGGRSVVVQVHELAGSDADCVRCRDSEAGVGDACGRHVASNGAIGRLNGNHAQRDVRRHNGVDTRGADVDRDCVERSGALNDAHHNVAERRIQWKIGLSEWLCGAEVGTPKIEPWAMELRRE